MEICCRLYWSAETVSEVAMSCPHVSSLRVDQRCSRSVTHRSKTTGYRRGARAISPAAVSWRPGLGRAHIDDQLHGGAECVRGSDVKDNARFDEVLARRQDRELQGARLAVRVVEDLVWPFPVLPDSAPCRTTVRHASPFHARTLSITARGAPWNGLNEPMSSLAIGSKASEYVFVSSDSWRSKSVRRTFVATIAQTRARVADTDWSAAALIRASRKCLAHQRCTRLAVSHSHSHQRVDDRGIVDGEISVLQRAKERVDDARARQLLHRQRCVHEDRHVASNLVAERVDRDLGRQIAARSATDMGERIVRARVPL